MTGYDELLQKLIKNYEYDYQLIIFIMENYYYSPNHWQIYHQLSIINIYNSHNVKLILLYGKLF